MTMEPRSTLGRSASGWFRRARPSREPGRAVRHRLHFVLALTLTVLCTGPAHAEPGPAIPGALWTVSTPLAGTIPTLIGSTLATPTGHVIAPGCQSLTPTGSVAWRSPTPCQTAVGDEQGNTYVQAEDSLGVPVVQSLDASGAVRWTTSTGGFATFRTPPVLGTDGNVYFSAWDGRRTKVLGFSTRTGTPTLDKGFADVTGLYPYPRADWSL